MEFSNMIFPELHNWALVTGCGATLLIVSTVLFLMVKWVYHRNLPWQAVISLLIIGIGTWSLIIALDGYQQWLDIVHHTPAHGFSTYARYIDENYRADIFRCQIQFTVTAVLLLGMLFMLCWEILSHFLHRAGEVRSDILIRRKEIWKASKHDTTERSVS